MTSPRLLLAAGSVAASLVGIAPVVTSGTTAAAAPIRVGSEGIAVSATSAGAPQTQARFLVPQGMTRLAGASSGSPALASRTRLTVVRTSDGATIFTGSLATFTSLPVLAGTQLVVTVRAPAGVAGLTAAALLRWS